MPTRKMVKSLIRAIRNGRDAEVRDLIRADPALVNSTTSAPPKKDDGQSPLQIAFKTGRFSIAEMLLDAGAEVNFIESSSINEWNAPVIHDAIRAAAFNMQVAYGGSPESFRTALTLLRRLLEEGANPEALDSFGNDCVSRALLDLRIQLTSIPVKDEAASISHPAFDQDARQLLDLLREFGADVDAGIEAWKSSRQLPRGTYFDRFAGDSRDGAT